MGILFAALLVAASTALTAQDQHFVDRALALNAQSLQRAQIVETSSDNYVLDYAEAIVGDRRAANTELAAMAQSAGYRSPSALQPQYLTSPTVRPSGETADANQHKLAAQYAPVPYFEQEVAANRQAVALYQSESTGGSSAALRSYAQKFLPKMEGELNQATHLLHVEMSLHPSPKPAQR